MPTMLRRLREFNDRYALIILLWTAFFVHGGKTPKEFLLLGAGVLSCSAISLWTNSSNFSFRRYKLEIAVFLCLCFSQMLSLDPTTSLSRSAQLMAFLILWTSLKANPALLKNEKLIYVHFALSGLVGLLITLKQIVGGKGPIGFFPINLVFNYSWLACIGLALIARLTVRQKNDASFRRLEWPVGLACVLLASMGTVRSVLLALPMGIILLIHPWMTARRTAITLVAALAAFCLVPNKTLAGRLRLSEANYRSKIWSVAVRAAKDRPIAGWGLGNFEMAYQRYAFPVETDTIRFARTTEFCHNEYLQTASEIGLIAFLILAWAGWSILSAPTIDDPPTQKSAKAALIVLLGVAVNNIAWHLPILVYITLLMAGLLFRERWIRERENHPGSAAMARFCGLSIILFVGGALGWSAVRDYWAARHQWRKIVRVDPRDAAAWENWADEQKEEKAALFGYLKAAELVPTQVYYHERLAETLENSPRPGFLSYASSEYESALRLAPSRAIDALALGHLRFRERNFISALDEFRQARRIEPHYWEADVWIARSLAGLGRRSKAVWTLRFLKSRRERYLSWRNEVGADLPSSNGPAPYDRIVLAYDEAAVQRDLERILTHQALR